MEKRVLIFISVDSSLEEATFLLQDPDSVGGPSTMALEVPTASCWG